MPRKKKFAPIIEYNPSSIQPGDRVTYAAINIAYRRSGLVTSVNDHFIYINYDDGESGVMRDDYIIKEGWQ